MSIERGLYTPEGFIPRSEIMAKLAREDREIQPIVNVPEVNEPLTFDQHIDRVMQLQELQKETGLWKDEISITVDTGKLPFFAFRAYSDMHMGATGVSMEEVRTHLQDIKSGYVHTALLGDIGDFFNPMKHPEGMMGDVINPDDQLSMIRRFYEEYKDSILCTVQDPSHTDWIRQVAGIEPQRYITEGLGINALKNGGLVHLKVNNITYEVALFHQIGKYNSSLNITNAGKRMMDMHADCDLVISGHTHIGDYEKLVKRNKRVAIVQLGTFKCDDDFGTRKGLVPHPQIFFPTILFNGKKKNIEIIEDREDAVEYVKTYQKLLSIAS